jgi:hypothetical protein
MNSLRPGGPGVTAQIERVIRIEEHETVICSVKNIKNQIGIGHFK